MGLVGSLYDIVLGGRAGHADLSGAFPIGNLGTELQSYLMRRLKTPTAELPEFLMGSTAIRESLGRVSGEARQRLGDTATSRGFLDSGTVLSGIGDIDRAELESYSQGLRELFLGLELSKSEGVLPYLQSASNEFGSTQGLNIQRDLGVRGQNQQLLSSILEMIGKMKGKSGGGE